MYNCAKEGYMNIDDLIDELLKKTYKTKYSSGYGYYDSYGTSE